MRGVVSPWPSCHANVWTRCGGRAAQAPPNSLEDSEPVEQGWDMIATAVLVFRLYSFQQQMSSEWEQEQLAWLTEHYGSWTERVLLRLRGR